MADKGWKARGSSGEWKGKERGQANNAQLAPGMGSSELRSSIFVNRALCPSIYKVTFRLPSGLNSRPIQHKRRLCAASFATHILLKRWERTDLKRLARSWVWKISRGFSLLGFVGLYCLLTGYLKVDVSGSSLMRISGDMWYPQSLANIRATRKML